MTADEMRAAIEPIYASTLEAQGGKYRAEVPEGVTPMSWYVQMAALAADASPEEFMERYGQPAGQALASLGLSYGCTEFGSIRVEDRPEAQVRGHMKNHKRERALIVHALGWKGIAK